MIYTLGYAKQKYAKFVDSGATLDNPVVVDRINESIQQMLMIEDWHLTIQRMRFFVQRNSIVLPYFADRIVTCRRDSEGCGYAGYVWSKYYEFMETGPLNSVRDSTGMEQLVDRGSGFPTMYEIERDHTCYLVAFSSDETDTALSLHIRGVDANGAELMTSGEAGITLQVSRWEDGVEGHINWNDITISTVPVAEITSIVKPVSDNHITLMAVVPASHYFWFLAKYHPAETNPSFHIYKIMNFWHDATTPSAWTALVKLNYFPAASDNDPLLVQNMPALKAMIQSLQASDAGDIAKGREYKTECIWLLQQQVKMNEPNQNEFQIEDNFALGSVRSV